MHDGSARQVDDLLAALRLAGFPQDSTNSDNALDGQSQHLNAVERCLTALESNPACAHTLDLRESQQAQATVPGHSEAAVLAADELDAAGVSLWNAVVLRHSDAEARGVVPRSELKLQASIRDVARRMIAAARQQDADESDLAQLSNVHSRTGTAWLAAGDASLAEKCFDDALKTQERLANICQSHVISGSHRHSSQSSISKNMALSRFMMYLGKSQLEWEKHMHTTAFFDLKQAIQDHIIPHLRLTDIQQFVSTVLQLSRLSKSCEDSITLCNMALDLVSIQRPDWFDALSKLKSSISLCLVDAHLAANAYTESEYIIESALVDDPGNLLLHHARMKTLASKPDTSPHDIDNAFDRAVSRPRDENMGAEETIKTWMAMIHLLSKHVSPERALVGIDIVLAREKMLENATLGTDSGSARDNIMIAKLYLVTSVGMNAQDASKKAREILKDFGSIVPESTTSRSCQLVLWKAGDDAARARRWADAIAWYSVSTDLLLSDNLADSHNGALLHRKLSLCYLELGRLDEALAACRQASELDQGSDNALTRFLWFAVHLERDEADHAIQHLSQIPVSSRMDLYVQAANQAQKKGSKSMLKEILKMIVSSNATDWQSDTIKTQVLTVLRCLIKLCKSDLKIDAIQNKSGTTSMPSSHSQTCQDQLNVAASLLLYIRKACDILKLWKQSKTSTSTTTISSTQNSSGDVSLGHDYDFEVDWLFRTSWNVAVAVARQPDASEIASQLFELVVDVIDLFQKQSLSHLHSKKSCLFVAALGRLTAARNLPGDKQHEQIKHASELIKRFHGSLDAIERADRSGFKRGSDAVTAQSLAVEFELEIRQEAWDRAEGVLDRALGVAQPLPLLERLCDLSLSVECDEAVAFRTIQATLDMQMRLSADLNIDKFSRWFRVLVRMGMCSQPKCLPLFEQALALIKSAQHSASPYPSDETKWLMTQAWNKGCEMNAVGDAASARAWCRMGLSLGEHVAGADALLATMRMRTWRYFDALETMIVVKATHETRSGVCEIRRLPMSRMPGELTFDELCVILQRLFRSHLQRVDDIVLKYIDEDGDSVCLESDVDVSHALSISSVLKVVVLDKNRLPAAANSAAADSQPLSTAQRSAVRETLADLRRRIDALAKLLDDTETHSSPAANAAGAQQPQDPKKLKSSEIAEFLPPTQQQPQQPPPQQQQQQQPPQQGSQPPYAYAPPPGAPPSQQPGSQTTQPPPNYPSYPSAYQQPQQQPHAMPAPVPPGSAPAGYAPPAGQNYSMPRNQQPQTYAQGPYGPYSPASQPSGQHSSMYGPPQYR